MLLYNISIMTDDCSHDAVYAWLLDELRSGLSRAKFLKMQEVSPLGGTTYCVHLVGENEREIASFEGGFSGRLQDYIAREHAHTAFVFYSKMTYIDLG